MASVHLQCLGLASCAMQMVTSFFKRMSQMKAAAVLKVCQSAHHLIPFYCKETSKRQAKTVREEKMPDIIKDMWISQSSIGKYDFKLQDCTKMSEGM